MVTLWGQFTPRTCRGAFEIPGDNRATLTGDQNGRGGRRYFRNSAERIYAGIRNVLREPTAKGFSSTHYRSAASGPHPVPNRLGVCASPVGCSGVLGSPHPF
jgi:hypothetical protein